MFQVKVEGLDKLTRDLNALAQKQVPFAMSRALNTTAFAVMNEGRKQIESAFVGATKWTVKSWYVRKKASKKSLVATVGWSDYLVNKDFKGPDYYLAQHFYGGTRQYKRFEEALRRKGILPDGMNAVPGKAADEMGMIDARGNMKGSVIVAIMSALEAHWKGGYNANATTRQSKKMSASKRAAKKVYWAGKPGPNTPNGIWALDEKFKGGRGRLRPVLIFVRRARYEKRLDLDRIGRDVVSKTLDAEFSKELAAAIRTAK